MSGMGRIVLVTIVALVLAACNDYQRYKQLETYRVLSLIAGDIDRTIDRVGIARRQSVAQEIIDRHAKEGRDAWGYPIRFYEREEGAKYEWVVMSCGSDGEPDVKSETSYFTMVGTNIHRIPTSDIVFRDGIPITEAGK